MLGLTNSNFRHSGIAVGSLTLVVGICAAIFSVLQTSGSPPLSLALLCGKVTSIITLTTSIIAIPVGMGMIIFSLSKRASPPSLGNFPQGGAMVSPNFSILHSYPDSALLSLSSEGSGNSNYSTPCESDHEAEVPALPTTSSTSQPAVRQSESSSSSANDTLKIIPPQRLLVFSGISISPAHYAQKVLSDSVRLSSHLLMGSLGATSGQISSLKHKLLQLLAHFRLDILERMREEGKPVETMLTHIGQERDLPQSHFSTPKRPGDFSERIVREHLDLFDAYYNSESMINWVYQEINGLGKSKVIAIPHEELILVLQEKLLDNPSPEGCSDFKTSLYEKSSFKYLKREMIMALLQIYGILKPFRNSETLDMLSIHEIKEALVLSDGYIYDMNRESTDYKSLEVELKGEWISPYCHSKLTSADKEKFAKIVKETLSSKSEGSSSKELVDFSSVIELVTIFCEDTEAKDFVASTEAIFPFLESSSPQTLSMIIDIKGKKETLEQILTQIADRHVHQVAVYIWKALIDQNIVTLQNTPVAIIGAAQYHSINLT